MDFQAFARSFRASSPYIRAHRDRRFVIAIPNECLQSVHLKNLVRDLALLHVLDIRLVLLLEASTKNAAEAEIEFKEFRKHLVALFERGLPSSPFRNQLIPTLTTRFCRKHRVDGASLKDDIRNANEVVIVEPFCADEECEGTTSVVSAPEAVLSTFARLKADKLILLRNANEPLLADVDTTSHLSRRAFENAIGGPYDSGHPMYMMETAVRVFEEGCVKRCHVVSYENDGALLGELFTPDGTGLQVSDDDYLSIRKAATADIDTILELMRTDVEQDRLVPRDRDKLTDPATTVYLAFHDETPVGCVALYRLTAEMQEIGSLVAATKHRDQQIGGRLLARAEREAKQRGAKQAYVFSKHTTTWFLAHDYELADISQLPVECHADYDFDRQPTLLIKDLT